MSTGSSTSQAPFARSALSAASARESLPVWLHDSRGVAEIAEENNPNGGRFSLKTAKKPANRLKCLSMNNLHAKPWLFPSAPIKANQSKSGHKYRIPSLKSASAAENVAQPSSAAGSSAAPVWFIAKLAAGRRQNPPARTPAPHFLSGPTYQESKSLNSLILVTNHYPLLDSLDLVSTVS
jgi:hypothetical protein